MKKLWLMATLLVCAVPSFAENTLNYNLVNLSESATISVERDQMTVHLQIREEGKKPAELTKVVTEKANSIIRLAKQYKDVTVTQTSRNSSIFERKTFGDIWHEMVVLQLTGKNFSAINEILAQVQDTARINGIYFSVSREKKEQMENELTASALGRLSERSRLIARTMGLNNFRIVNMNIGSNNHYAPVQYQPRMAAMAKMGAVETTTATPVLEHIPESAAGNIDMSLSVSAQIQLYHNK